MDFIDYQNEFDAVYGGDSDSDEECITRYCSNRTSACELKQDREILWSIISLLSIIIGLLIMLMLVTYCCRACLAKKPSGYVSAASLKDKNERHSKGGVDSPLSSTESPRFGEMVFTVSTDGSSNESDLIEDSSRLEQRIMLQQAISRKLLFLQGALQTKTV